MTICDTLCLLKPKSTCSRGDEWLEPLHFARAPIPPGTYRVKLAGYSRAAAAEDQEISRRVFTEEDHAAWWAANRAYVVGDLPKVEFEAEKNRIEGRTHRGVDGMALSFSRVELFPVDYDPGDLKLDLATKQDAAKLLERRCKAN